MARRELVAQMARLDALFTAAAQPLATLDADVGAELAQLATLIAERALGYELSTHPERIVDVVRQSVAALPANTRHLRVHLHPDDAALVRDYQNTGEYPWQIVDDVDLQRGDCRLESENSSLDATRKDPARCSDRRGARRRCAVTIIGRYRHWIPACAGMTKCASPSSRRRPGSSGEAYD